MHNIKKKKKPSNKFTYIVVYNELVILKLLFNLSTNFCKDWNIVVGTHCWDTLLKLTLFKLINLNYYPKHYYKHVDPFSKLLFSLGFFSFLKYLSFLDFSLKLCDLKLFNYFIILFHFLI